MASSSVSGVYIHVIDDVISKVREEFVATGAGESVLTELQGLREMKMMQCGAITESIERPVAPRSTGSGVITSVHDLNVLYEGPIEEYETPTAEMLFPPTPMRGLCRRRCRGLCRRRRWRRGTVSASQGGDPPERYIISFTSSRGKIEFSPAVIRPHLEWCHVHWCPRKTRNEALYSSLDNFLNQTVHVNLDSMQDGYSLAFPEFPGTDFSGYSSVLGDLNNMQTGNCLHDAQGILGDDDSIYVSLGEIPIGFMEDWDQSAQEYGKFF